MMTRRSLIGALGMLGLAAVSAAQSIVRLRFTNATHSDDVLPVSSQSAGTFSANAFTGFSTPGTTVYTDTGLKYLKPTVAFPNNEIIVATNTVATRDHEITTYVGRGTMFLRIAGAPGAQTAFYCSVIRPSNGDTVRIGIVTGFDETQNDIDSSGTRYTLFSTDTASADLPGFSATDGNSTLTFGVLGFSVYLKINGTTVVSLTEWRHMSAGRAAVYASSNYGARDIRVHYPQAASLYSDPATNTFDIRDFGARALTAVGSMTLGSPTLTLTSNPGFVVGQRVIVEIGGESGAGLRGSFGVGGQWPILHYANTTAMNADTSQPNPKWAYDESTLLVYAWDGSSWSHRTDGNGPFNQSYYQEKIVPQSLVATITAVAGSVVTLDASAVVATTNAMVYLDCADAFNVLTDSLDDNLAPPATLTLSIPVGTFALGSTVAGDRPGLTCRGVSHTTSLLKSPKGTPSVGIRNSFCDGAVMRDFGLLGNFGADGFGLQINASDNYVGLTEACIIDHASGALIQRIAAVDTFNGAAHLDVCSDSEIDGCSIALTSAQFGYLGWMIQLSSCTDSFMHDCSGASPFLFKCFEVFNSTGCYGEDLSGQNTLYANNSSGSVSGKGYVRCAVTVTAGSFAHSLSSNISEPVFNINTNYAPSTDAVFTGWTIKARVVQQGYIDSDGNSLIAIAIQANNVDVSVIGDYPEPGAHTTTAWGYFEAPDYDSGSALRGSQAVYSLATGTEVDGIRVAGDSKGGANGGNIELAGASGSVTNCVADIINGGTQSGNQSNAGY